MLEEIMARTDKFCRICGKIFDTSLPGAVCERCSGASEGALHLMSLALEICPNCEEKKKAEREHPKFCWNCGIPLEQECPYCGRTVPTSRKYQECSSCYSSLKRCDECFRYFKIPQAKCENNFCPNYSEGKELAS